MGRIDVDNMLAEITVEQFEEWAAYYLVEPWDVRYSAALIARTVSNSGNIVAAATLKAKWEPEYAAKFSDFLGGYRRKKKTQRGIIRGLNDNHR